MQASYDDSDSRESADYNVTAPLCDFLSRMHIYYVQT